MMDLTVFLSHAWSDTAYEEYVKKLALEREPDLAVQFDLYDVQGGTELTHFMERSMRCDRVVHVCDPSYKQRADERRGGVGFEARLGSAEIFRRNPECKFIPVLRGEDPDASIPDFLSGITYVDAPGAAPHRRRMAGGRRCAVPR
jgi:TIR domain-containing protein